MAYWWESLERERYWCEITDREDIGADLKCPQTNEAGKPYWSYSLIHAVWPGDVVFHYSTNAKAYLAASVAGGPLEERSIVWTPHGTVGRSKTEQRPARPGWWRPLYGLTPVEPALTLADLQADEAWIREWISAKEKVGAVAAPIQLYPGKLRAAQGYLTKMPADFVDRWASLSKTIDRLATVQDDLTDLAQRFPGRVPAEDLEFKPKPETDYVAVVKGGVQRRSRNHERLVRVAAEYFKARGGNVGTKHPLDLLMTSPFSIIFEAKVRASVQPGFAIREAVGQLLEYRHFVGPRDALLCILLDANPGDQLVKYVEDALDMLLLWSEADRIAAGPLTAKRLGRLLG